MRILITGCLGYIATSLFELLVKSNKYELIGIDNQFNDRVSWLIENNIKFYQLDLFNIKHLFKDIDVVIHCGATTSVPTTLEQSSPETDKEILRICVEGTKYLIDNVEENTKIIFLSSHTVYDGLKESILNIDENYPPNPLVAYSLAKRQSEIDLFNSNKKFTILRLGSVTGLGRNMRINIVGNLFAKFASQDQKIRLFGGGNNIKPLVCLKDVARCIQFFIENDYNREIFHLVSDNLMVKEIANICKEYNNTLVIEETNDKIPNLGYSLNNSKLLSVGFKFKYNIKDEIRDMINKWSNK